MTADQLTGRLSISLYLISFAAHNRFLVDLIILTENRGEAQDCLCNEYNVESLHYFTTRSPSRLEVVPNLD